MNILVINAGSSSLKYQLINGDDESVLAKGLCERIAIEGSRIEQKSNKGKFEIKKPMASHADAIKLVVETLTDPENGVISSMDEIGAVGHRVVHGGEYFSGSVIIDDDVKKALEDCIDLAPLHNPPNLIGIEACEKILPNVIQVGVFDTAFHQTMPPKAYLYGIPYELYEKYKIRKYGFHGTSHKYVADMAIKMINKPIEDTKIVTLHLGNGSSITAINGGKSVDTSMGFTPLAGLMMGTRSGAMDPAVVTFLMEKEKLDIQGINDLLNKKSGVLGISNVSSDFRDIEKAADGGNEHAKLALDMFIYRAKRYIGYYAAAMGGIDAVVFTAGIGENNCRMRAGILEGLEFMGIKIDDAANKTHGQVDISAADAAVKTFVIPTNEELMIARDTKTLVENK